MWAYFGLSDGMDINEPEIGGFCSVSFLLVQTV